MPAYTYKARTREGKLVSGEIISVDEPETLKTLEKQGLYPVSLNETRNAPKWMDILRKRNKKKIKHDDKILFTRQLQSLLNAGISLTGSLRALADQAENETVKSVLEQVVKDIEGGSTLAQAIQKHPNLFSNLYVNLLNAGEEGGVLDEMLDRMGYLLEYEAETQSRIRSATFYPSLVIGELLMAFIVIIKFVFPRFKALFSSRDAALPLPTVVMLKLSDFFSGYWPHMLIGSILGFFALRAFRRTYRGRKMFDNAMLNIPIFGELIVKTLMSRFSRVLGALLESGLPIVRALDLVLQTIENVIISEEIRKMQDGIKKGLGLTDPIRSGGVFPPPVVKMLEVGEQTGDLSIMLNKISDFYDRQLDYKIKNLTTVLEPILLVILGVSVLFIALAVFLPMWNLMHVVTGA